MDLQSFWWQVPIGSIGQTDARMELKDRGFFLLPSANRTKEANHHRHHDLGDGRESPEPYAMVHPFHDFVWYA